MKRSSPGRVGPLNRALREAFLLPLHLYRRVLAPILPPRCRYYPSCSAYGVEAVRELGIVRGSIVAAWRVVRCNPFSDGGVDELADRTLFRGHEHRRHTKHEAAA